MKKKLECLPLGELMAEVNGWPEWLQAEFGRRVDDRVRVNGCDIDSAKRLTHFFMQDRAAREMKRRK